MDRRNARVPARERDALGRPLPPGVRGVAPLPDDSALPPREALLLAESLLDAGLPFQAHEVLEAVWKAAPEEERELWQGLAQLAVGVTHHARGNSVGAAALLRRAAARIGPYARPSGSPAVHGVAAGTLATWAAMTADAIEAGTIAPVGGLTPPRLMLVTG